MVRTAFLLFGILAGAAVQAQDLGRTERLFRQYLGETVHRGIPLGGDSAGQVPYWPQLERARADAASLEPGADVTLLTAWIDRAEGGTSDLRAGWPRPALTRFSSRQWGETLFAQWDASSNPREWTDAWLAWQEKTYSPRALLLGLNALEKIDPSAVVPLLSQALELYPEDRRFLALVARHPEAAVSASGLVARDRANTGGWTPASLAEILTVQPLAHGLLREAGYTEAELATALQRDYALWLASGTETVPQDGGWNWDSDLDGDAETSLVFEAGALQTWSRRTPDGLWTLSFLNGKPDALVETRGSASWTLRWEAYPWAATLEYRWGDHSQLYRFRPLAQAVPLWPAERMSVPAARLPAVLASLWLPLDPRALAAGAATVETWAAGQKIETLFLFRGEVWLDIEDSDRDGRDDTWSYFRSGKLASVYRDLEGRGSAGLRELYRKGEIAQVQAKKPSSPRNEFVLFPLEGVQLWDPHGDGRPLQRLFVWQGDRLGALVFGKDELPWETMPAWEARP